MFLINSINLIIICKIIENVLYYLRVFINMCALFNVNEKIYYGEITFNTIGEYILVEPKNKIMRWSFYVDRQKNSNKF